MKNLRLLSDCLSDLAARLPPGFDHAVISAAIGVVDTAHTRERLDAKLSEPVIPSPAEQCRHKFADGKCVRCGKPKGKSGRPSAEARTVPLPLPLPPPAAPRPASVYDGPDLAGEKFADGNFGSSGVRR